MNDRGIFSLTARGKSYMLTWSDERLVRECLDGNEDAWAALINKYKNLIFSIPIKYGMTSEDAADLFQAVCLELFSELGNLRKVGALRSWLISITVHKSFHWKKKQRRKSEKEVADIDQETLNEKSTAPPEFLEDLERAQTVREAVGQLPDRCRELVRMLFYEDPPVPYNQVAQRLGLALGSIGFIRGRCLQRLHKLLAGEGL